MTITLSFQPKSRSWPQPKIMQHIMFYHHVAQVESVLNTYVVEITIGGILWMQLSWALLLTLRLRETAK